MWRVQDILGRGATACVHKALCAMNCQLSTAWGSDCDCDCWSMHWMHWVRRCSGVRWCQTVQAKRLKDNETLALKEINMLGPYRAESGCNRHHYRNLEKSVRPKSCHRLRRRLSRAAKDEIDRELRPDRSSKQFIMFHNWSSQTSESLNCYFLAVVCKFKRPHICNKHSQSWLIILLWAQYRMLNYIRWDRLRNHLMHSLLYADHTCRTYLAASVTIWCEVTRLYLIIFDKIDT